MMLKCYNGVKNIIQFVAFCEFSLFCGSFFQISPTQKDSELVPSCLFSSPVILNINHSLGFAHPVYFLML